MIEGDDGQDVLQGENRTHFRQLGFCCGRKRCHGRHMPPVWARGRRTCESVTLPHKALVNRVTMALAGGCILLPFVCRRAHLDPCDAPES